jgi:hypothetical protein
MDGGQFEELLELARQIGIAVRHVRLGGTGGGLAKFKNQRQLFIDLDAAPIDQLEQTAKAMASVEELQQIYVRPDVRKLLEEWGTDAKTTQAR